jgi:hypothetical protein
VCSVYGSPRLSDKASRKASAVPYQRWDENIVTEWHSRYRHSKRVLISWTVADVTAMAVQSALAAA